MKRNTKIALVVIAAIVFVLSLGMVMAIWFFTASYLMPNSIPVQPFCGGIAGINCPTGYECELDDDGGNISDAGGRCVPIQDDIANTNQITNEPIEYSDSFGSVCPVSVKFLGSKTAPEIKCQCPEGYTMDSTVIGYSTGDACYGSGTECPILSSECVLND